MSGAPGIAMLATVGVVLLATGLPSWVVLLAVALSFGVGGVISGAVAGSILTAMSSRLVGLLESDILQALPLYVLLGALLNHLPLADILFRVGSRALRRTGAGPSLAGLSLAALLAPMNGSVGASALMLGRAVQPRLDASGLPRERGAALVCVASTLGIVVPPSLVLILLGDAMLRAHTEALNVSHVQMRIVNTQDVFIGSLVPAAVLFVMTAAIAWWRGRVAGARSAAGEAGAAKSHAALHPGVAPHPDVAPAPPSSSASRHAAVVSAREIALASGTLVFIVGLLAAVTIGYLFAVEAAATGAVALVVFGIATRSLTLAVLKATLRDAIAVTGALFALLLAATVFTLVVRALGTDVWLAGWLPSLPGGAVGAFVAVFAIVAACGLVLDAFEMIFVVIPIVMPPLLALLPEPTWIAVLTLLVLQASFLMPPLGYALLLTRQMQRTPLALAPFVRSLAPYIVAQWLVFALVVALPSLVWQRNPLALPAAVSPAAGEDAGRDMLLDQLNQQQESPPADEQKE